MPSTCWRQSAWPVRSRGPIRRRTRPWGRRAAIRPAPRDGAIINHFVRGYWFAPAHPATGPGLLAALRFGRRWLYDLRLTVDDDALPISRASAEAAIQTVHQTLATIDQHTQGGHV